MRGSWTRPHTVDLDFSYMRRIHFLVVHGNRPMITVIDYRAGNLTSVVKALNYLGSETLVTQDPGVVLTAEKVVLPGVGHFQATQLLSDLGLTDAVRESVGGGAWFLGICVGLQWLFEGSTEAEGTKGLGEFVGMCERFPAVYGGAELKSPHVGWNSLEGVRTDSRLLRGVKDGGVCVLHAFVEGSCCGGDCGSV